ncbi:glutathione S-transferase Mu 1-like [Watersipora subatra]|uniref:glutathione S-transferase Mu 1-like n=1 Tax=Watersipora subatra TaxID=2589382 RepID=UPI00355C3038
MAPILGYWEIRGLAHSIRLLLHYKEAEFVNKMYPQGPPPDFSREAWYSEKFNLGLDFPNLPYYIDGDVKLTETSAIFAYLGRKYNLCGSTEDARVRNDMVYSVQDSHRSAYVRLSYSKESDFEALKRPFVESLPDRLEALSKFLGDHEYFGGAEIVYSDFCVYDLLDTFNNLSPGCVDKYANLKAYLARIEALPTLKKFLSSPEAYRKGPFNSKIAAWGSKPF